MSVLTLLIIYTSTFLSLNSYIKFLLQNLDLADGVYMSSWLAHYGEHLVFLSALSTPSDSLTGRQRKDLPSHGRRVRSGHIPLRPSTSKHLEKLMFAIRVGQELI